MTGTEHQVAYPLYAADTWRATCRCHWWQPVNEPRPGEPAVAGRKDAA